jgi:aminoglycoside 6'-N-acetyltransferase
VSDVSVLARPLTDGVVTIRPASADDIPVLVAGRDEVSRRFLGEGDPHPSPVACIVLGSDGDGEVVGWVDHDHDRAWLSDDEVNLGYALFPGHRGKGYATRAVELLVRHLAADTDWRVATLLIDGQNEASLALADRAGFTRVDDLDGHPYWKRPVRP